MQIQWIGRIISEPGMWIMETLSYIFTFLVAMNIAFVILVAKKR